MVFYLKGLELCTRCTLRRTAGVPTNSHCFHMCQCVDRREHGAATGSDVHRRSIDEHLQGTSLARSVKQSKDSNQKNAGLWYSAHTWRFTQVSEEKKIWGARPPDTIEP